MQRHEKNSQNINAIDKLERIIFPFTKKISLRSHFPNLVISYFFFFFSFQSNLRVSVSTNIDKAQRLRKRR